MKILTLGDRKKIEQMWEGKASPVEIAAELGISQATVYTELRRGSIYDAEGKEVLDGNFRRKYSAEQGETVYQQNRRNQGRRPAEA